jgi:hypothetical protein
MQRRKAVAKERRPRLTQRFTPSVRQQAAKAIAILDLRDREKGERAACGILRE